jgi:hypothetical protein
MITVKEMVGVVKEEVIAMVAEEAAQITIK